MDDNGFRLGKGVARALVLAIVLIAALPTISAFADEPLPLLDHVRLSHVAARLAAHQPIVIVAFGSSSTEGRGASSPAATYPSRLLADLTAELPRQRVIVINQGIGGDDADDMALRLPTVIAERPDLIIWQTGSNDPLRNVPLDRYDLMRNWLAAGVLTWAQMLSPDGLHMADGGYAKLADAVTTEILHRAETPRMAMDTGSGN
jgi:lysophospholipase L1-like esterase